MRPGRLEALVDGVFAIALTLLVLDLPKPAFSAHLAHDLARSWPSYVAYLVSFVTIGLLWIEHHGMMSAVRSINRRFLERTLAFLLFISIIPWPTALAAGYARQGTADARVAAILYASAMLLMGLTFAWGWRYLTRHGELVADAARPAFPAGDPPGVDRRPGLPGGHRGRPRQSARLLRRRRGRSRLLRRVDERRTRSRRGLGRRRGRLSRRAGDGGGGSGGGASWGRGREPREPVRPGPAPGVVTGARRRTAAAGWAVLGSATAVLVLNVLGSPVWAVTGSAAHRSTAPLGATTVVGTGAHLDRPDGIAEDALGDLFIADTGHCRVREVPARPGTSFGRRVEAGRPVTVAGGPCGGPGAHPAPSALAVDAGGDLFIASGAGNRVEELPAHTGRSLGTPVTAGGLVAVAGTGTPGGGGDGGPARLSELDDPTGIAVDPQGDLLIDDTADCRLRLVAASDGVRYGRTVVAGHIQTVAGTATCGSAGDGGAASGAQLWDPGALAVDAEGDVALADQGNRSIRLLASHTGSFYGVPLAADHLGTVAGEGSYGPYLADGLGATSEVGETDFPTGLAFDARADLFIADGDMHAIRLLPAAPGRLLGEQVADGRSVPRGRGPLGRTALQPQRLDPGPPGRTCWPGGVGGRWPGLRRQRRRPRSEAAAGGPNGRRRSVRPHVEGVSGPRRPAHRRWTDRRLTTPTPGARSSGSPLSRTWVAGWPGGGTGPGVGRDGERDPAARAARVPRDVTGPPASGTCPGVGQPGAGQPDRDEGGRVPDAEGAVGTTPSSTSWMATRAADPQPWDMLSPIRSLGVQVSQVKVPPAARMAAQPGKEGRSGCGPRRRPARRRAGPAAARARGRARPRCRATTTWAPTRAGAAGATP